MILEALKLKIILQSVNPRSYYPIWVETGQVENKTTHFTLHKQQVDLKTLELILNYSNGKILIPFNLLQNDLIP